MKERKGYEWVKCGDSGYWTKTIGESHRHKLDFFCPHCRKPTGSVDDKFLHEFGVCWECFTIHIEERKTPTIDLSRYKKNQ
jgi:hypothetical protein